MAIRLANLDPRPALRRAWAANRSLTFLGLTMLVALAGLPPTVGFTAKWLVFSALWDSFQRVGQPWMLWLLIGGILNAAISLAYYLRIPFLLFFRTGPEGGTLTVSPAVNRVLAGVLLALVVLLFFRPNWLIHGIGQM